MNERRPEAKDFEYAYYGSYYDDKYDYIEEYESEYEPVRIQINHDPEEDFTGTESDVLIVLQDVVTGQLWGAMHSSDSWHEEAFDFGPDEPFKVVAQQVTYTQYVAED